MKERISSNQYQAVTSPAGEVTHLIIPIDDFRTISTKGKGDVPHEVFSRCLTDDVPLIRAWREHLDLSQADVAARLQVSQSQYSKWESGNVDLRLSTLNKIADALGLDIEQLLD